MVLNVLRNHKAYQGRRGGRGYGGGGRGRLYTYRYTVTTSIPALRRAAMTAIHVSFIVRDKVTIKTVSTNHNLSEEKGEPKRYRTEVLLSAYQPNALPLGQTGSQEERKTVALIFNCWDPTRRPGAENTTDMGEGRGGVLRVVPPVIAKHTADWYNQFRRAPSGLV